jgi:transcriptional regulator with GAF, ATPase, and Fis domain
VLKGQHQQERPSDLAANMPRLMDQFWKLEHENYLLRLLYDAGRALNAKLSIEAIAEQAMSLAFRISGVERGFMMLMDEKGEITTQTEVRYRRSPAKEQPQIILSRAMLERMKEKKEPVLITDATEDERFLASESMKVAGLRSAMCAPLVGTAGHLAGILYVDNMDKPAAFTQEEMNVFAVVASQAAAAIDNAAAHRMLAEQALQQRALERFLSPEVVEMISANPKAFAWEASTRKSASCSPTSAASPPCRKPWRRRRWSRFSTSTSRALPT